MEAPDKPNPLFPNSTNFLPLFFRTSRLPPPANLLLLRALRLEPQDTSQREDDENVRWVKIKPIDLWIMPIVCCFLAGKVSE